MTVLEWIGIALLVFVAAVAYEWANSNYIKTNSDNSYAAVGWGAMVSMVGIIGWLSMLEVSPWLSVVEIGGFSVGTGLAIWRRRRRCSK